MKMLKRESLYHPYDHTCTAVPVANECELGVCLNESRKRSTK